jgi:hypothetical protein
MDTTMEKDLDMDTDTDTDTDIHMEIDLGMDIMKKISSPKRTLLGKIKQFYLNFKTMISAGHWSLFLSFFFVIAILISLIINWLFLRISFNLGAKSKPNQQIRWAANVKPAVGGFPFL